MEAVAYAGRKPVGKVTGKAGDELSLRIPRPHLWTPDDPYLYTLKIRLRDGRRVVDEVGSYFGMRSISLGKGDDGKTRMLLNGTFVPQVGTLDQGYWPDGVYTAPTDEALKFDLVEHKKLGFNMVRKHMKVEPDRWFYWADRLGLLVWQDMPAMFGGHNPPAADKQQFETEMQDMVRQHDAHPSVVMWVPFNEGWGEYEPKRVADTVKGWDPSRLVNADSGVNCCDSLPDNGEGDIYDDHTYVGPGSPPVPRGHRATVARRVRRPRPQGRRPRVRPRGQLRLRDGARLGDADPPLHRGAGRGAQARRQVRPVRVGLHADHRRGEGGQRPLQLRPAGAEDGRRQGPRGQPGGHRGEAVVRRRR
ncbi:glycoside hydrolase family 2 protein [Actinomadura madurae]|uniref:glycoside hydrolase family 2 protein n=1 Tax=Actinomadura madurae TaxID=1993 RepID=UPI0020D254F7|nr:glycoside hydrolase family 2 TIM barrel-domain containing protein [Actinomadura madurae]MCQ0014481.1 hypothetical protein [Actinomadura madurae]